MGPRPCGRGKMGRGDSAEDTEPMLQGGLTTQGSQFDRVSGDGVEGHTSFHLTAALDGRLEVIYSLLAQYLTILIEVHMTTPFADATGARIIKFIDRLSAGRYLDVRLLIEHIRRLRRPAVSVRRPLYQLPERFR